MSAIQKKLMADIAAFQEGYVNPSQAVAEYFGNDIKWLRAVDLNDSFVFETSRGLSQRGFESAGTSATLFKPGSLAISKSGTIGRLGILQDYMCGNRAVINIQVNESRADPRFIFYSLLDKRDEIVELANGSVQKNLYVSALSSVQLDLPPIEKQRRIVEILGSLDDKIELNRRMNETLEAISRRLFKSWFVDFDPVHAKAAVRRRHPNWPNDGVSREALPKLDPKIAKLFPDDFEDSTLGPIPKGWRVGSVVDVADNPRRGIKPEQIDPGTPYIALEHIPRRSIALAEWTTADGVESGKFEFHRGEILFGKLRPYFHKVGIAPVDGVCSTDVLVVVPKSPVWLAFALGHISSDAMIAHTNAASTGTKMPRTNWGDIARFEIVVPDEHIAAACQGIVAPLFERIAANIHESRPLAAARDRLLPSLLSGELHPEPPTSAIGGGDE